MAENTTTSSVSAPLSVIIIGCGRVAEKHLKAISKLKGLELKAVVDTNPDSAKRLLGSVKGFANVKQYSDYKTAIDEVKPSIVSVTVPSGQASRPGALPRLRDPAPAILTNLPF